MGNPEAHSLRETRRASREARLIVRERETNRYRIAVINGTSHEFRTPLAVISGTAATLAERSLVVPAGSDLLGALVRASSRLEVLVETMLFASGVEDRRGAPEGPVDLVRSARRSSVPSPSSAGRAGFASTSSQRAQSSEMRSDCERCCTP